MFLCYLMALGYIIGGLGVFALVLLSVILAVDGPEAYHDPFGGLNSIKRLGRPTYTFLAYAAKYFWITVLVTFFIAFVHSLAYTLCTGG